MPRSKTEEAPVDGVGAEGKPTVPTAFSLSCRKCGSTVAYDEVDETEAVACPECGALNLHPDPAEPGVEDGGEG